MSNKGMVVKIKDSYCIILAGDGTYHKIPRSRVSNPRVGAESEFFPVHWTNSLKPLLMVACLLVAVLGLNFFHMAASAVPVAYVALDINPSIELGVDKYSKVTIVTALNKDAEKLMNNLDVKGEDLYSAVRQILDKAASSGYIRPEETNYILSTVTPVQNSPDVIDYKKMAANLENAVENRNLDVNLVILSSDDATRQEARDKDISTGKLLVYKNSIESGKKLSLEQVKDTSVTTLVRNNKVLLLPGKKKGFIKLIRVPRKNGHLKESSFAAQDDSPEAAPDLTTPVAGTDDQDKPAKENEAAKPKPNGKDKTKLGESILIKLREMLNLNKQDNISTPETENKDRGSKEKQGGKNKKSRPADPVKGNDKKSQTKTNSENVLDEEIITGTSDDLSEQKSGASGYIQSSGRKSNRSAATTNDNL